VNEVIRAAGELQSVCEDWIDLEGIVIRQSGRIDWPYVRSQLAPLVELKEAPEILRRLEERRRELEP
jgi:hypothetical protein